ncbi:KCNB1 [Lepeophtheirus salmonis]|uniref:KCNB1 n=1 Tax=Lepeophtheirus salmonis TaxID=72036 RepID=A0A7R8CQ00_LEPSM|nr:KCNB1 [Lepeophtheirus salmonis]CAF2890413.1 KCNB1 [Lepeophtheirus salmonis]
MTESDFGHMDLLISPTNTCELDDETRRVIGDSRETVLIDVGGMIFKVRKKKIFAALPNSRLSRLIRAENMYRIGGLHLTVEICATVFKKDLNFWGIDELYLEPCCALKYYPEMENCVKELRNSLALREKEINRIKDENFGNHYIGKVRSYLWNVMEYPESSLAARQQRVSTRVKEIDDSELRYWARDQTPATSTTQRICTNVTTHSHDVDSPHNTLQDNNLTHVSETITSSVEYSCMDENQEYLQELTLRRSTKNWNSKKIYDIESGSNVIPKTW